MTTTEAMAVGGSEVMAAAAGAERLVPWDDEAHGARDGSKGAGTQ